jgi:hypothetical protein
VEYRKLLLGAASVLAVSSGPAAASLGPTELSPSSDQHVLATGTASADPLLDLVIGTKGVFTVQTVEEAVGTMYTHLSTRDARSMPGLLVDLIGLGVSSDVVDGARRALVTRISESSLPRDVKVETIERLGAATLEVKLASKDLDEWCDPESPRYDPEDPDCAPLTTEAIGDNSGSLGGNGY